jgi:hypothetical protein
VDGHGGLDGGDMAAKVCRNDGVMDRCRRCVKMIQRSETFRDTADAR